MGTTIVMAQDDVAQLEAKATDLQKQLVEIEDAIKSEADIIELRNRIDNTNRAYEDGKRAKLASDPRLADIRRRIADADARRSAAGVRSDGTVDGGKILSASSKANGEAAALQSKEAREQERNLSKELLATPEIQQLDQAARDARKAYKDAVDAKISANPNAGASAIH